MIFEEGHIYHVYNQGNNRQRIFYKKMNYLFFLEKIKLNLLPFADVMAWCLMPNHFHLMIFVNNVEVPVIGVASTHSVNSSGTRSLNQSLAILLRSYTRALNIQENRTGALFREGTKAECITRTKGLAPSFFNTPSGAKINLKVPEQQYPQLCFDYIHQNPVKARMVKKATDWEFSSARDYAGLRNGKLINKKRAEEYVIHRVTWSHPVNEK